MYNLTHFILCLSIILTSSQIGGTYEPESSIDTCSTEELNHSVLIECNTTSCGPPKADKARLGPKTSNEILHVFSTRAGARLAQVGLVNLNYEEDANAKLLDINTTLTAFNKFKKSKPNKIIGFGASIDISRISGDLEAYGIVLEDLCGELSSSGRLTILRLPINVTSNNLNLSNVLTSIDQHVAHSRQYNIHTNPLKILLEFIDTPGQPNESSSLLETARAASSIIEKLSSIEIWALALDQNFIGSVEANNQEYYEIITKSLPSAVILASTSLSEAPYFVDKHLKRNKFQGLLVKGQQSIPYNVLDYLASKSQLKVILTVGSQRPKTSNYGDWDNAQNHAVEILRHLGHGSNGFIEALSVNDVLSPGTLAQDSSLYNIHTSDQVHFKGPMFYATSHFSRYLPKGSEPLEIDVFTQPNMFSAHYSAFRTPNNHIVAIVLNSNDHLLPFRLGLDNKIVAHTYIEAKSFNTLIIKL